MCSHNVRILIAGLFFVVSSGSAISQEWTRFRGPNGSGLSPAMNLPVKWTAKDFNWKVALPGQGHSSPVLWGNRIFITSGERRTGKRIILCIDANNGKMLWRKDLAGGKYRMHRRNSVATSTPVVDAKHLYVAFATPKALTLISLDHDGNIAWQKDLGRWKGGHGYGVSPIVFEDLVILANDQDKKGSILGVDKNSGAVRWSIPRKSGNATYSTPCVFKRADGKTEIVFTNWQHGVTAVDPLTGNVNWETSVFEPAKKERAIASPIVAGDLVLGTCGFVTAQKHFVAIRPPAADQNPKEIWRIERSVSYLPSPLYKDGLVFLCSEKGVASCLDAKTGKIIWQERLGNTFYASPVCAGDRIYCTSTEGEVYVLKAARKFQVLARNSLGEATQSTPAIARGRIFFRTARHLISLGEK